MENKNELWGRIFGLPPTMTETELKSALMEKGFSVEKVLIAKGQTGTSEGWCWIKFPSAEEKKKLIDKPQFMSINDSILFVTNA